MRDTLNVNAHKSLFIWLGAVATLLALDGCHRQEPATETVAAANSVPATKRPAPSRADDGPSRDLSIDESAGGHTLSRHVGKTDQQLADRLRREPQISSASTYVDRPTAERVVGSALSSAGNRFASWERRNGRRPNLVLNYVSRDRQSIGRSLSRGQPSAVDCDRALIVLRWNERANRFYVLTSYPEARR